jgi:hypothetical protein
VKLVYATNALHDFISLHNDSDFDFLHESVKLKNEGNHSRNTFVVTDSKKMQRKRDTIVNKV